MLHYYIFILYVIVLQSVSVIKINQKYFGQEILHYLPISFNRKNLLLALTLDLNQMYLILVI